MLGGEWDSARRLWVFERGDGDRVRTLCREIYGADGSEPFPVFSGVGSNSRQFAEGMPSQPHYFGRRERLRERMIAAGPESLPDYELLEVILFAARPRGDVKPVAKALLAHFGSLGAVMAAEPATLTEAGLNLAGISAIKAAREAALRLMRAELQHQPVVKVEEFHSCGRPGRCNSRSACPRNCCCRQSRSRQASLPASPRNRIAPGSPLAPSMPQSAKSLSAPMC
jgi:hypothetical protein